MIQMIPAIAGSRQSFVHSMTLSFTAPPVRALLVGFDPEDFPNGFDDQLFRRDGRFPWIRNPADLSGMALNLVAWVFMCDRILPENQERWIRALETWLSARNKVILIVCSSDIVRDWLTPVFDAGDRNSGEQRAEYPVRGTRKSGRTITACVRKHLKQSYRSRQEECERILPLIAKELGFMPHRDTVLWTISKVTSGRTGFR